MNGNNAMTPDSNKSRVSFAYMRLIVGILSVVLLGVSSAEYKQEIALFPHNATRAILFSDGDTAMGGQGQSTVTPLNSSNTVFLCDIKAGYIYKSCGISIMWLQAPPPSNLDPIQVDYSEMDPRYIDISALDHLRVRFSYRGDAEQLRLFFRNAKQRAPRIEEVSQQKLLSAIIEKREFNAPIKITPQEFVVPRWWVEQENAPRIEQLPELNNTFQFGVDMLYDAPLGRHFFTLEEVTAVALWLPKPTAYFVIVVLWLLTLMVEIIYRVHRLYADNRQAEDSIHALEAHNQHLKEEANNDPLTHIYNRRGMHSVADILFTSYPPLSLSVLVLDIDYFKHINDSHGHNAGDDILKQLVTLVKGAIRSADAFGRWGGEEFVLICQHSSAADAYNLAEKLRTLTSKHRFDIGHQQQVTMTLSIGIAVVAPHEPFEHALDRADQALYHAKDTGRNCVRMA